MSGSGIDEQGEWHPAFAGQREPFKEGNTAAMKHGAQSPAQIVRVARAQKRRWLRQAGLRASDLDGVALALLDNWARAQAKIEMCDQWYAEHGFLDEDGEPHGPSKIYFVAINSARLAATRLAEHTKRAREADPFAPLNTFLAENYGDQDGNGG